MNITDEQVIQWMHQQREKHGLHAMQITVHAPIEARAGHGPISPFYTVAAHKGEECRVGESITEAVSKLAK